MSPTPRPADRHVGARRRRAAWSARRSPPAVRSPDVARDRALGRRARAPRVGRGGARRGRRVRRDGGPSLGPGRSPDRRERERRRLLRRARAVARRLRSARAGAGAGRRAERAAGRRLVSLPAGRPPACDLVVGRVPRPGGGRRRRRRPAALRRDHGDRRLDDRARRRRPRAPARPEPAGGHAHPGPGRRAAPRAADLGPDLGRRRARARGRRAFPAPWPGPSRRPRRGPPASTPAPAPAAAIAFSAGPGWAAALEAALLLKEVAGVPAEGVDAREGATSAMYALGAAHLAVSLPVGDPAEAEAERLCAEAGGAGRALPGGERRRPASGARDDAAGRVRVAATPGRRRRPRHRPAGLGGRLLPHGPPGLDSADG